MSYTKEQLIEGLNAAVDAGDNKAANEIGALLAQMDAANAPPPDPNVRQPDESYVDGVQRRFRASDFQTPFQEFGPELQERLDVTRDPMSGTNTTSRVAGAGVSQVARTGGEIIGEGVGVVVPDFVRDGLSVIGESGYAKAVGYAVSQGLEAYQGWSKENPEIAEQVETLVDVSALFSPRPDLLNLDKAALAARKAGTGAKVSKEKIAFTSLLAPEKLDTAARTEKRGLINTEEWVPNEFEEGVIDLVQTIPGIKPYGTVHENFRVMQNHVDSKRVETDRRVTAQNKPIDLDGLKVEFEASIEDYLKSDVVSLASPQAKKAIEQMVESARVILNSEGNDLLGVLKARRRFDEANRRSGTNLDADVATYKVEAALTIRTVLNDYLKKNTTGDELHQLLNDQHLTLTALDRLTNKRNLEGKNALARGIQNLESTGIRVPSSVLSVLALGSVGVAGAAAAGGVGLSLVAGAGVGGIVGMQIARHGKQNVLKAYATTLSAMNKAIKTVNDPVKLEAMELDRQVIVSLMADAREYEEEEVQANE